MVSKKRKDSSSSAVAAWRLLQLPDVLVQHVLGFLPDNTVPYAVRLACKDAAAMLSAPQHRTFHLGEQHPAIPADTLRARWASPGSTSCLTYKQRAGLLCAAARSGDIPTMQQLLATTDCVLNTDIIAAAAKSVQPTMFTWLMRNADCPIPRPTVMVDPITLPIMKAAVQSGSLDMCNKAHVELERRSYKGCNAWLHPGLSAVAAETGSLPVCQWTKTQIESVSLAHQHLLPYPVRMGRILKAPAVAALNGHVHILDWALQQLQKDRKEVDGSSFLPEVAWGCDLATLQRMHQACKAGSYGYEEDSDGGTPDLSSPYSSGYYSDYSFCCGGQQEGHAGGGGGLGGGGGSRLLQLAAADGQEAELFSALFSPLPDWEAKAQWLLARGYPRTLLSLCYPEVVAPCSYAVQRLEWMRANGVVFGPCAARTWQVDTALRAAACGNTQLLEYLLLSQGAMGAPRMAGEVGRQAVGKEGGGGFALGSSGSGSALGAGVGEGGGKDEADTVGCALSREAAERGQLAALQLLVRYGRELGPGVLVHAARTGSVEVVEWCWAQLCGGEAGGGGGTGVQASASAGVSRRVTRQQQREQEREEGERKLRLLGPAVMEEAARSGSTALVQWLHARGCAWDGAALGAAAMHGSQEMVEWMAGSGCPMPVSVATLRGLCSDAQGERLSGNAELNGAVQQDRLTTVTLGTLPDTCLIKLCKYRILDVTLRCSPTHALR